MGSAWGLEPGPIGSRPVLFLPLWPHLGEGETAARSTERAMAQLPLPFPADPGSDPEYGSER
jgi:hypothetical protein